MVSKTPNPKMKKETLQRIDGKIDYLGGKLSILSLLYLWLRSTTLIQGSFNYAYFQGTGYSQAIFPFFKRIYGANKEQLKAALISNIEFFNTGPILGMPIIMPLHVFMLQTGASQEETKAVKFALMGPLAGINDSLFNFGSQPLIAGIAAALSSDGSWLGFWFWMLVYNAFQCVLGIAMTFATYRSGQKFITNISETMTSVIKIASMVGITIISALSLTYTQINLALDNIAIVISNGSMVEHVTSFQEVVDKFIPFMLPMVLVSFIYFMMTKKSWSIYKALMFIMILGITGYVFGIFG